MHKVRIEMTGFGRGHVFLDDHEIEGVYSVKFESAANDANTVHLTLYASEVVITGPAEVVRDFVVSK
jgi:hypothetical protein